MGLLAPAIGFGIASGAIIALGALGFTLQFALSDTLNVAYGGFVTVAAFLGYSCLKVGLDVWVAMAVLSIVMGVISVCFYEALIEKLMRRGVRFGSLVIATLSAGIVIQNVVVFISGSSPITYGVHGGATVRIWEFTLSQSQLILIFVSVAVMLAVHVTLTRTTAGRMMRATAANAVLARSCGIRTNRVTRGVWFISGALAGAAGVALAMTTVSFDFTIGAAFLLPVIAAAVLGGVGQPYGAMVGGLLVGLTEQLTAAYISPAYSDVITFALLVVVLLVRPSGLFGVEARRHDLA